MGIKFGLVFPQTEFGNDPVAIKDYAQTAEQLGFNHILAYDHVLGANPDRPEGWSGIYSSEHPFHEVFVLFTFMAAATSKIEFTTGILVLPQRQTPLVAKQAAELDILSGGRLRLGVGLGWNEIEYQGMGADFHNRGQRVEEQVEVLKALWTQPLVTCQGRWHTLPDVGLNPLPTQRPIPIWFGGHHDNVLRRVATLGDGWLPNYHRAEDAKPSLEKLAAYIEEAGRDRSEIGVESRLYHRDGDPSKWRATIESWEAVGVTHITFNTMDCGFENPAAHMEAIRKFAQVIALL